MDRISYYEQLISAVQTQILALATSSQQAYSLNTSQSSQSVTKKRESELNEILQDAIEQLENWTARLSGGGATVLRPFS